MVAVKLWYLLWYYGLLGNQKASTLMHKYNHNTLTTLRTSVRESLQMHFKVTIRNSYKQVIPSQMLVVTIPCRIRFVK